MLFNSYEFFLFYALVLTLYWSLRRRHRVQNGLLLAASYFFYGCWSWKFLSLIFISTLVDYICSLKIHRAGDVRSSALRSASGTRQAPPGGGQRAGKPWLILSIVTNLAILGFFKYFNFFSESLVSLLQILGLPAHPFTIHIMLPIGISFYTFQSLGYTIDVYRRQMTPTRNFADFALFIAFFSQLVAGPVERARNLLPQVQSRRRMTLDGFYEGCWLIFWGLFKKVVIADNLARVVDPVFSAQSSVPGGEVLIALYAFAFQVYCDFSGYSDIARGSAKLMGFDIIWNFNLPFFAESPRDFWRRWHISLSTWFRDYLYIPLGGNRRGPLKTYRNILIVMILMGLWHGAAWNFVCVGLYFGLLIAAERTFPLSIPNKALRIFLTFHSTCLGFLMFRAASAAQILHLIRDLTFHWLWTPQAREAALATLLLIFILLLIQVLQYLKADLLVVFRWPAVPRALLYLGLFYGIILFGVDHAREYVYFQF